MLRLLPLLLLQGLVFTAAAQAASKDRLAVVSEPYIELHTGPGRGYPIFQVAGRGDSVTIVKRRTDWFLVSTERGIEGWVSREQMLTLREQSGEPLDLGEPSRDNYLTRRWQAGVLAGDFGGASELSIFAGYAFSDNLSLELTATHVMGDFSKAGIGTLGVAHVFAPEWRVSPYFTLGTGLIYVAPKSTLVRALDRTDQVVYAGGGLQGYLTRRFMVRMEYRSNVALTSRDENEEVEEWKIGFAFFL